jgi:smad nuclear-interacting protein 1
VASKASLIVKQKPNFGISGALAKDDEKGNIYKGVVLKLSEPPEARAPNTPMAILRLQRRRGSRDSPRIETVSLFVWDGNEDIADIPLRHGSCSSQRAVLQYRSLPNKETGKLQCLPYLMDLESTNGSFINGVKIDSARYYQLKKGDVLKFGASTREYVLLTANATSIE